YNKAGFLSQRDDLGWRHHPALRVVPAQECFEPAKRVASQVIDRLIVELEFTFHKGPAQIHFQDAPCLHAHIHPFLEEAVGAAALTLGAIERDVGILEELLGLASVMRRERNADAGADYHLVLLDDERRTQGF